MKPLIGSKEYFKNISKIEYEGRDTDNPFAYRFYNKNKIIAGKSMQEHFKFAIAYWHSLTGLGTDPFGSSTQQLPWLEDIDPYKKAIDKMDAGFEFITKLGVPYYCFHDVDLIEEGNSLEEFTERLNFITDYAKNKQDASGVRLLWGTANLFSHPRCYFELCLVDYSISQSDLPNK